MTLRWKGELGDGHVHMTSREFVEHRTKERDEQMRQLLRKIANNPILTKETQAAIRYAIWRIDENAWHLEIIEQLKEQIKNMKARNEK